MSISKKLWLLVAGALAGTSFAMAVDQIEPKASASVEQLAAQAAAQSASQVTRQLPASQQQIMLSYAPLVKKTAPAVVNVFSARVLRSRPIDPFYEFFFGRGRMTPQQRIQQSLGSGVIVDESGLIVTNNHVVEGADEIVVSLADRREFPAKLLFKDEQMDLALLQIDPGGKPLPTVTLGDSDSAEVGDVVIAIGNPFGVGQTVTQGIVSAVARTGIGISDYQFFIQTDAAINPGNSGGALLGMDGTLVGINTAIYSRSGGSNGIGFAIPANAVKRFVAGAKAGKLARTWIGVSGQAVTPDIARATGLDRPTGVLVNRVTEGSPADRAGIRVGDVIYAINGHDAFDPGALKYLISTETPGETVKVTLLRKGEARNVDVRLTAPPETPPRNTTTLTGDHILAGVTIANLSPALVAELGSDLPERGVVVMRVDGRAPAARLGFLRPGDIIEAVNGSKVSTVGDVKSRISGSSREASIRINRGGQIGECYFRAPATFQCRS